MSLICKCGFEHKDNTYLISKIDPLSKRTIVCSRCGRRVFVKTLTAREYKRILKDHYSENHLIDHSYRDAANKIHMI